MPLYSSRDWIIKLKNRRILTFSNPLFHLGQSHWPHGPWTRKTRISCEVPENLLFFPQKIGRTRIRDIKTAITIIFREEPKQSGFCLKHNNFSGSSRPYWSKNQLTTKLQLNHKQVLKGKTIYSHPPALRSHDKLLSRPCFCQKEELFLR